MGSCSTLARGLSSLQCYPGIPDRTPSQLRKPGWWLVLADDKSNRIVVPPLKISDVPASRPGKERDYRCYKVQFQAPPNVGLFTWKVYLVSDTLVGEELCRDITVRVCWIYAGEEINVARSSKSMTFPHSTRKSRRQRMRFLIPKRTRWLVRWLRCAGAL